MRLVPGELYHIYNRGNNKERIFYEDRHYRFFQTKMEQYLCPHADLLAFCLLPNHFHLLIRATPQSAIVFTPKDKSLSGEQPIALSGMSMFAHGLQIALSSYTRGFNKMHKRTGSLFTQNTRCKRTSAPAHQMDYSVWCFVYIHNNPVKAGLVARPQDWPWSSFRQYLENDRSGLCNISVGREVLSLDINHLIAEHDVHIPHQIIDQIL